MTPARTLVSTCEGGKDGGGREGRREGRGQIYHLYTGLQLVLVYSEIGLANILKFWQMSDHIVLLQ